MSLIAQTATLAHGYTMAEIDAIARLSTHYRANRLLDQEEAMSVAWHAVVVALYEATEEPVKYDLVSAGARALSAEIKRVASYQGLAADSSPAPRFQMYWSIRHVNDDDFTERIAERLSLPVVLGALTPKEYEAVSTVAAFDGDVHAAAEALGMRYDAVKGNLTRARKRIKSLWFEHETPRTRLTDPDKCRNGHSREHSERDAAGVLVCAICRRATNRRADRRHKEKKRVEVA